MCLCKYDACLADRDLVCLQPGEYTVFPFRQPVFPLSALSALVWETGHGSKKLIVFHGRSQGNRSNSDIERA
ncbi:hypothetical protein F4680DRAFT_216441 [Xylaria scruposa]|nr:hypothetical protein F4680DRAFT_216441 [Xylaria scruposa]